MQAILRQTRISPKKANLVAGLVRGKKVDEAINILKFTPKKGAKLILETIKSAAANASNNFKQDRSSLFIKEIIVNEGITYKRSKSCSRGRIHPILKRNSHITVKLDVEIDEKAPAKPEKKAEAEKEEAGGKEEEKKPEEKPNN